MRTTNKITRLLGAMALMLTLTGSMLAAPPAANDKCPNGKPFTSTLPAADSSVSVALNDQVLAKFGNGFSTGFAFGALKRSTTTTSTTQNEVVIAATNGPAGSIGYESPAWSNSDWLIQPGDQLVFWQYSTTPWSGMFFYLPDGSTSIDSLIDIHGCLAASFCGTGWQRRVVPLDAFAGNGNYIWHIDFWATPQSQGTWETHFRDVTLVRANGTVKTVFSAPSSLDGWYIWNYADATVSFNQSTTTTGTTRLRPTRCEAQ